MYIYVYVYVCMYVCLYVRMYVCTYVYIHTHTYIGEAHKTLLATFSAVFRDYQYALQRRIFFLAANRHYCQYALCFLFFWLLICMTPAPPHANDQATLTRLMAGRPDALDCWHHAEQVQLPTAHNVRGAYGAP